VNRWAVAITTAAVIVALVILWRHISGGAQGIFGFRNGDGNSSEYLFWSGAGSDLAYLSFLAGGIAIYRRHNCAYAWCPRIGKHEFTDPDGAVKRMLCWKHHPDVKHKTLHKENVRAIQERRHLYFGKKVGRG
jgi:hypothetical protein